MCEVGVQLHSFRSAYPIFPAPFVEKAILSSIELPGTFAKDHLLVNTIYFYTTSSIPLTFCRSFCQCLTVLTAVVL